MTGSSLATPAGVAFVLALAVLCWPSRGRSAATSRSSGRPGSSSAHPGVPGASGGRGEDRGPGALGERGQPGSEPAPREPGESGDIAASGEGPDEGADDPPTLPGTADVATAMELLALVLSAGGGLVDAVEAVARTSTQPVRGALGVVAAAVRWGMPWRVAWDAVGPAWAPARRALALANEAGVAPAAALRRAAADLRAAQVQELELAAATLGVAVVVPLGTAFLPAFVLLTVVPLVVALAGEVLW